MNDRARPYKKTPAEAAESWVRRFGYQGAALARRHALAYEVGPRRTYWLAVAKHIERPVTSQRSKTR